MGYLKRYGDKKYRIIYDLLPENGKRRQKRETLEGVSKKEAEAILAEREAEIRKQREAIENGEHVKDEITFSELFERFMKSKRTNKETTTVDRYESLGRLYLKPCFGTMAIRTLKPFHLTAVYADWQTNGRNERHVSPRTIRHAHELLRNVLNWGIRNQLVSPGRNAAESVSSDDLPKAVKPKPLALNEIELRTLLGEAKSPTNRSKKRGYLSSQPWFYPAVVLAAYTGARRGEILALRWHDVDFDRQQVTFARSITEKMAFKAPKNDKPRTVSMPDALRDVLADHRAAQDQEKQTLGNAYQDQDLVFARADGSPINPWNFGSAVRDCIKRAGVTAITLHGLRDTHASLAAKAGVPLEVVSKRLGHSTIAITAERYLDVYQDRDRDAAAAFGRLVG